MLKPRVKDFDTDNGENNICAPKMIMSYSTKVEMSYSKLQYPDVIGGYCDGQGHDNNEQERDKKTAHYPPGVG